MGRCCRRLLKLFASLGKVEMASANIFLACEHVPRPRNLTGSAIFSQLNG
jgi:hypothetical protein